MRKNQKVRGCILLMLLLMLALSGNTFAASQKSKALKAYKKMLSANTMKWGTSGNKVKTSTLKFGLVYIDKDAVPELVVLAGANSHVAGSYAVYTYTKGKTVLLANSRDGVSYYKKTGVLVTCSLLQGEYTNYFTVSSGKAALAVSSYVGYYEKYYEGEAEKVITKKAFQKKIASLTGRKKKGKITYRKNTAKNRNKYLK